MTAYIIHIRKIYIVLLQILEMLLKCFAVVLVHKIREQESVNDPPDAKQTQREHPYESRLPSSDIKPLRHVSGQ